MNTLLLMSVTVTDVDAAAARLSGRIQHTPLLESLALNNLTAGRILVKAENLQLGGSFKIRGAMNRVLTLDSEARSRGVVAFSSGNFGQGLAAACMLLGVKCTIVMPQDAPQNKRARSESYGATVVLSDVTPGVNREITAAEVAEAQAKSHGYTLLHPFEDKEVIAGQGTCAMEIAADCKSRGINPPDALLICTGGGGLAAGCCLAAAQEMPSTAVYIVEPEGYDDHVRSFASGNREAVQGSPPSLCDSLQAVSPGRNTWPINSRLARGAFAVSDAEVRYAMRVALETLQISLEPGGAAGLAAVLAGKIPIAGRTICVIASGGNIDLPKFAKVLGLSDSGAPTSAPPPPTAFDWTGIRTNVISGLKRPLIVAQAAATGGILACGYVNPETCDKFEEPCAIVKGVATAEDMLRTKVVAVSAAARALGVEIGMLGAEALDAFRKNAAKL